MTEYEIINCIREIHAYVLNRGNNPIDSNIAHDLGALAIKIERDIEQAEIKQTKIDRLKNYDEKLLSIHISVEEIIDIGNQVMKNISKLRDQLTVELSNIS